MKRLIAVITSLLLILTMVAGCARNQETPPAPTQPPATEAPQEPTEPETPDEGNTGTFTDGTFNAQGEADERGWTPEIEIVVENGEITQANYDEVNEEGNRKSEDEEYAQRWSAAAGIGPREAYEQLEQSLIETQDPDQVETVSGATGSSELFRQLANEALTTNQ